jgi:hypothetical protein
VHTKTLHKRMREKNLLLSVDEGRGRLTVRKTLQGVQRTVLHLAAESVVTIPVGDPPPALDETSGRVDGETSGKQETLAPLADLDVFPEERETPGER